MNSVLLLALRYLRFHKFQAVILDHHVPQEGHLQTQVNPHLIGFDGGSEVSGSGVAYSLARIMGKNTDLAGLAISGAIGDKQRMQGVNKDILDEGVKAGAVNVQKGLKLDGKTVVVHTNPAPVIVHRALPPYGVGKHVYSGRRP